MGLRGIGAKPIKTKTAGKKFRISIAGKTRADRVISFIESLPITSGILAGRTFKLGKWQKRDIRAIYKTDKTGSRIVRLALQSIPRKNGKSSFTAALALCHLCGPEAESRGEVYSAANDRTQAAILFREMKAMILATDLDKRVIIRDFAKQLEDSKTGSIYQALSADVANKHGFSASFWAYDELAQAPNRKLYDVLSTSGGGRKEPLGVVISTQSADPHSVMSELVDYGEKINAGEIKDSAFHATIYAAPEDSDPWKEKTWRTCNPGIECGFRSLEEIRTAAMQAKRIPAREAAFRLLYLNQRVNIEARFINMADWDACAGPAIYERLKGLPCYGGLDLSSTTDLSALVLVFPGTVGAEGQIFTVLPFFWIPKDGMDERERRDKVPYALWERQGLIEATPGNRIDYKAIMRQLGQCRRDFDFRQLCFDRWGSDKVVNDLCDEIGFTIKPEEAKLYGKPLLIQFGQGFRSMSPPTKELGNMILGREIAHGGHAVLRWNADNVRIETDPAGNIKPVKNVRTGRIDGIVGLIMGLAAALKHKGENEKSVYEERGVLAI